MSVIKQLAEQAGVGRLVHVGGGDWDTFLPPELVVFTDLIIQECCNLISESSYPSWAEPGDEREAFIEIITDHFGVK